MDFTKIRTDHDGPRGSFEQLVCQLARREKQPPGSQFRRIEGSGGDGGIEAYWLLPDNSEVGYQAKYFLNAGRVNWRQIDHSVEAAIANHPKLTRYVVALACDLTHQTGGEGRGSAGWAKWNAQVSKWEKLAASKDMHVKFEPWTAFDLRERLTRPESVGLRAYWFREIELAPEWFAKQLANAIANLDDRFHPEDHVELGISRLFLTVCRSASVIDQAKKLLGEIAKKSSLKFVPTNPAPDEAGMAECITLISDLLDLRKQPAPDLSEPWGLDLWQAEAEKALFKVGEIISWAWSVQNKSNKAELQDFRDDLRELTNRMKALSDFLAETAFAAERDRVALIHGPAGSGKSHLLANEAKKAIERGAPAILLLGQQLREGELWPQLISRLGFETRSSDEFLGALDAAAEANGTRALVLVDAINEGAGRRVWLNEIGGFLTQIRDYQHIACIFSCRTEYIDSIVPASLIRELPIFYVEGFRTDEEQERAARIYLDSRGILRPATPWLSPEFVNPLFLRSCAHALNAKGLQEFPRGLKGTKAILHFYLDSLGYRLDRELSGGRKATECLIRAVKALAGDMAEEKRDYVAEDRARALADVAFRNLAAPEGTTWLDFMQRHSVIRRDPEPSYCRDPLEVVPDVVRFSFQRFQEALMAEALLEKVTNFEQPFAPDQPLHFIIAPDSSVRIWAGLVEALSTQLPERCGKELVDLLPGGLEQWWDQSAIMEGFAQSVRWRDPAAFTDRTLAILDELEDTNVSVISLLLEVSISADHPYNALWVHKNLLNRSLAKRDALWSLPLAAEAEEGHPCYRLITWAMYAPKRNPAPETLAMCATTLCWFFGTPHRPLRDKATKALTVLLRNNAELFGDLVSKFADVNDPYIIERLFSAAYGAACLDPNLTRLEAYAHQAYYRVFAGNVPPILLLRDHARGIIQLAERLGCLPSGIDPNRAQPPYTSEPAMFDATEEDVERLTATNGDRLIKFSCINGDFGHYTIRPAVCSFYDAALADPKPTSDSGPPLVSVKSAFLWVTRRAYEFGWTEELFPQDRGHGWSRLERPEVERIGKKYQRLALDELLCRLADNKWMTGDYGEEARVYADPDDIGFLRDIDPTVLPDECGERPGSKALPAWAAGPAIDVSVCTDKALATCPSESDPGAVVKKLTVRQDQNGVMWYALFDRTYVDPRDSERETSESNIRKVEFRILMSGLVPKAMRKKLTDYLARSEDVGGIYWGPIEIVDGPYLHEAAWRSNWISHSFKRALLKFEAFEIEQPVAEYEWESHLDCSLPSGARSYMPSPRLIREMHLVASPQEIGTYVDAQGEPVFISGTADGANFALIKAQPLDEFLAKDDLSLVWTFISERNAWSHDNLSSGALRRSEAVCWKTARGLESKHWNKIFPKADCS